MNADVLRSYLPLYKEAALLTVRLGVLGIALAVVIGLLCVVYGAFAGLHIMKGSRNAESLLTRLLVLLVVSLVVILSIQNLL